jgi:hypothetical protein
MYLDAVLTELEGNEFCIVISHKGTFRRFHLQKMRIH